MSADDKSSDLDPVQRAVENDGLSQRAAHNCVHRDIWGPREKSMGNPWSRNNPQGTVILRLAENSLMHQDVSEFISNNVNATLAFSYLYPDVVQIKVSPLHHLTYSTGPKGSRRLRKALANFLTTDFEAMRPIDVDDIFVTPGLASGLDAVAWALCNEGDGILIPRPHYNGFQFDLLNRSNVCIFGVEYESVPGYRGPHNLFDPEINRKALQSAMQQAKAKGVTIRALLISNPHNPLGRCYPAATLREFAKFCADHALHLISDEIYAKSVFHNSSLLDEPTFTSILSLEIGQTIDPTRVHVLYGASKDFCANGLRLGMIYSKNSAMLKAISSISMFSWSSHLIQDIWASMLEDQAWLTEFMHRKLVLLQKNYTTMTSFLQKHNISYLEMNAGIFVWVDLRSLFAADPSSYDELKAKSKLHRDREANFEQICHTHGVMIAPGSVYNPEEIGWFRITFSLDHDALEEGLMRLARAIDEARSDI